MFADIRLENSLKPASSYIQPYKEKLVNDYISYHAKNMINNL